MASMDPLFAFVSDAFSKDALHVVRWEGVEGLSRLFEFSVTLVSEQAELDAAKALEHPAHLLLQDGAGVTPFHGVLKSFSVLEQVNEFTFYRAVLVPRFWRLALNRDCQIFLDKTVEECLREVLRQGGLAGADVSFKFAGSYLLWPFICQYNESHYDFLSRWFSRDGIYYFFEHAQGSDILVATDSKMAHSPLPGGELQYSEISSLDGVPEDKLVRAFSLDRRGAPKKVLLKDYHYENPSEEVQAEALVDAKGHGEVYVYGEHIRSASEASALARIRAESFICRKNIYNGVSAVRSLRSGSTFTLKGHYRKDFNKEYLITEIRHEGAQEAWLTSGLGVSIPDGQDRYFYRNTFEAIEAAVQFRPERRPPASVFSDAVSAKIWTEGSEDFAHVDKEGRYRLLFPFDLSGRRPGKASHDVRRAQPYAGSDHGLHFPLHKGVEALVSFVGGHPDRPVILNAVPDPDHPSLVANSSNTKCLLTTSGQNFMHMEDQSGHQHIHFQSPVKNTWLRLGKAGANGADGFGFSTQGHRTETVQQNESAFVGGDMQREVKGKASVQTKGTSQSTHQSETSQTFLKNKVDTFQGKLSELKAGGGTELAPSWQAVQDQLSSISNSQIEFSAQSTQTVDNATQTSASNNQFHVASHAKTGSAKTCYGLNLSLEGVQAKVKEVNSNIDFFSCAFVGKGASINVVNLAVSLANSSTMGASTSLSVFEIQGKSFSNNSAGAATHIKAAVLELLGASSKAAGSTSKM